MLEYKNMSSCCGVFRTSSLIKDSRGRNRQIESLVEDSFREEDLEHKKRAAATAQS